MAHTHAQSPEMVISLMNRSPSTLLEDLGFCEGVSEISKGLNWALSPCTKCLSLPHNPEKALQRSFKYLKSIYIILCVGSCVEVRGQCMTVGSLLLLHVFGDGTQIVKPAIRGPLPSEHLMSPRICFQTGCYYTALAGLELAS